MTQGDPWGIGGFRGGGGKPRKNNSSKKSAKNSKNGEIGKNQTFFTYKLSKSH